MGITAGVSYSIRGAVGRRQTTPFYIASADGNMADVAAVATALSVLVDNVVDGVIEGGHIIVPVALDETIKTDPVAGSRSPDGGLFSFNVYGSAYRWSTRFAAFKSSLFIGTDIPRTGATDTLCDYLLSAVAQGGHTLVFTDKGLANNLTGFIGAELSINKL